MAQELWHMKTAQTDGLLSRLEFDYEVGCDEAGRGCLAGPVVAAAVVFDPDTAYPEVLRDSKKLSAQQRAVLYPWIRAHARDCGIGVVSPEEIDEINILQASFLAMHRALDQFSSPPRHLLIDGNRFLPYQEVSHTCIIGGDDKFVQIAAASILAKHHRDLLMRAYHEAYPQYGWTTNMGYPTKAHKAALSMYGVTPLHRLTFKW